MKNVIAFCCMLLPLAVFAKTQTIPAINPKLPTVVVVATGGTIAEKADPKTGAAVPALSGADLIQAVPDLAKIANVKVVNFSDIDSSQMNPDIWLKLSQKVNQLLQNPKIAGIVITHGTDTMVDGAYFLDLTTNSDKPIVFTGAMRDASDISPDGPLNIYNAVLQAASGDNHNWGVTIILNQYINSARDARKTNTNNAQTFDSGERGYLGYIAMHKVIYFHDRSDRLYFALPQKLPKVVLLESYAGDDGGLIHAAVAAGAKGIVVEGVGAGNVNAKVYSAIQTALKQKVVVVISTRVPNGGVYPIYGDLGGGATLQKAGAILAGDLPGDKTRILLMLALTNNNADHNTLVQYFSKKYD
jgi:L-asparaginase